MKNRFLYSSSFILLFGSLLLIFYLHNEREKESQYFQQTEIHIHQLLNLSQAIDIELLRILNFRLNHYDSLVQMTKQLLQTQKKLQLEQHDSINLPIEGVSQRLTEYLQDSQKKISLLEHIKAVFSSYKITLRYIPSIADALKQTVTAEIKEQINALQALVLNYSLFPEEIARQQLQEQIERLQLYDLDSQSNTLMENLLHHCKANMDFHNRIQVLFSRYEAIGAIKHLGWIEHQLVTYIGSKASQSFNANNIFLISTAILLTGLLFGIHYFRLEHDKVAVSRNLFHDAIESINESFAIYDENDKLLVWNSQFEKFYPKLKGFLQPGLSYQEIVEEGIRCGQFVGTGMSDQEIRLLMQVGFKEALKNVPEYISGNRCYLANNSRISSGGIASVHIDITERRTMESQLIELSRAVEQSPASVIITDTKGKISYVNPKFEQVTGYSADEVLGKNPRILKSGHTSVQEYQKMWETIHSGKEWHGIFCNKKKNGELIWEQAIMSAIRDSNNHITAYLAIKEDITTRKAREEQLRMAAMVFETSSEAIVVTDPDNIIKLVNPSFEKITGYQANEVIGKTPAVLKSGRHDSSFYRAMWNTLYSMGRWQGEVWNRRKSGQVYPEWLSIALVKDEHDNVIEHVAVFSDISERKKAEDKIHWQANFDQLTQLPNRTLFVDRLKQFIAASKREKKSFALLFMDLDRFKVVNDTLGHSAGDQLLQKVARRLQENLSESDTVARFGGDEFTVLLSRLKTIHTAALVADRLIAILEKPFVIEGSEVFIGTSIGITIYPDDDDDEASLIRNADMAMYHAKENGRNTYRFYTQSMNEKMLIRMQLEKDLHRAIEENELFLEYQPVINPQTQAVIGAEALVRWLHPTQGRLGPDQFISIAEETGMIGQLGEWVLQHALNELASWHQAGYSHLYVAVNVSSAQRVLGFSVEKVKQCLNQARVEAKYLTLEITESLLMDHTEDALNWLLSLKHTGLKLSIDDFGTGFSSLSYLRRFPVDTLKVDKSFVDEILTQGENAKLVESIISLAHNFALDVVAEGVEEQAQVEFLEKIDCDYIQGYYYSKPLSAAQFVAFMARSPTVELMN